MIWATLVLQLIYLHVIFRGAVRAGWFGIAMKRQLLYKRDKVVDDQLQRVLARYRAGELMSRKTLNTNALLFVKYIDKGAYSVPEVSYYVDIGDENSLTFGWVNNNPLFNTKEMVYHNEERNIMRGSISTELWKELILIRDEIIKPEIKENNVEILS